MRTQTWTLRVIHERDERRGFDVKIEDEGAGLYLSVGNCERDDKITIDPEEWPALRAAINRMFKTIEKEEGK